MTRLECMEAEETAPQESSGTRSGAADAEQRMCTYCRQPFTPRRLLQRFCGDPHRIAYHRDVGTEGVVASVTRIKRGVSVTLHFEHGPAAEHAIHLLKGDTKRIV